MKEKVIPLLAAILLIAQLMVVVLPVHAASRTIVVPDDYATITSAIANANNGDIIYIKKGEYAGPINQTLVVNKSISIIGEEASNTILNFYPPWITSIIIFDYTISNYAHSLEVKANDVKMSGLTINTWIEGDHSKDMVSEDIYVNGDRVEIYGNIFNADVRLSGSYDKFFDNNSTKQLTIQSEKVNGVAQGGKFNSVFENNFVNHGIRVRFGSYNIVYGNNVKDGYGITVESSENIIACNTMINCSSGISLFGGKENTVVCNVVNCCGIGLRAMGMANCTFYANYIVNNSVGVWTGPHSFKVYGNNFVNNLKQVVYNSPSTSDLWYKDGQGNYWSNYRGIDLNADSIGDTSFEFAGKGNGTDRYPLMNPLDISSIEVSLPDWASDIPKVTIDTTGFAQNEPQTSVMIAAVIVVAVSVCLGVGLFLFRRHRRISKQQTV